MSMLLFAIIVLICYGIGRTLLNALIRDLTSDLDSFIFSTGLGLGAVAYLIYILGVSGFLYGRNILIMLTICGSISFLPIYKFILNLQWNNALKVLNKLDFFEKFLLFISVGIGIVCLFGAIAPEIGNDALAYHLYHPKIFIQNHKVDYIPFTRESMWPYLTEMLFTIGLIFKNVSLAKLFHYFFGVLSVLAIFTFTKRFFSRKTAILASTFFYSAPGIFMQSVYAYIDLAQCFYSFIAFYSMILFQEKNSKKFLILSGIFTGLVLSVKILGIITLATLFFILLLVLIKKKVRLYEMIQCFLIFNIFVVLFSSVWYFRSYLILHNPVYPFLNNVFHSGWPTELKTYVSVSSRGVIEFLRLPWDSVINFDIFGGEQIGVAFLVFLPFLFFVNFKNYIIRNLLLFLAVYTFIWYCITPNIRFNFVNFAIVFILISIGFEESLKKYNLKIIKTSLCICLFFNASLCLYYNMDAIKLALGRMNIEQYLSKKERTYPIAKFINKNLPRNSMVISVDEPRAFYFDRNIVFYEILLKKNINIKNFINNIKQKNPTYLLCVDFNNCDILKPLIVNKKPLFKMDREIDENKFANYLLYEL